MEPARICCLVCFTLCCISGTAFAGTMPVWKEHPYVFVERSEISRIINKARQYEWAKDTLENLRKSAKLWLEQEIQYPPSTGRHAATYLCPDCRKPLKTLSPSQHQCPTCNRILTGLPYDARLYKGWHDGLARGARDLGLASLLFEDPRFARKGLDILLGYGDKYGTYALVDTGGEQSVSAARIHDQTLDEAIWLIDIAWAFDLILGAKVGTPDELLEVEEKLLRPSIETIRRNSAGSSNWQSWHNAGLMAAGLVLKDRELVDEVIHGENGFFYQMNSSLGADATWYEGAWSYHFYALSALLRTAEAAYRSGINLYKEPKLKKMLEIPLRCLMPNGRLPALNDSEEMAPPLSLYEVASARYGDRFFQNVIAGSQRGGLDAFLIGIPKPLKQKTVLTSMILLDSGIAILRKRDQYIALDFGPHGGYHGHYDKLALNFFTAGQVYAPDPGRGWPYNLPIHREWYKRTLAHNTVLVDESPQKDCSGTLESYKFGTHYHTATARADAAYEGVKMRRTLVINQTWLLDDFEVESNEEHTYDWVWHGRGKFSTTLSSKPVDFKGSYVSYNYLRNVREGDGSRDWSATWKMPGGEIYALFKGSPERQSLLCDVPDNPSENTLHSVILRDKARKTRFVALFSRKAMKWEDLPAALQP